MIRSNLPMMVEAYLECALWSSVDEDGDNLDDLGVDFAPEAREQAAALCAEFYDANAADLEAMKAGQAGHDLWLTRNHHGAGFWDRGLGALGRRLTDAAHVYGECHAWIGNNMAVRFD